MINVGFKNYVPRDRVVFVGEADSELGRDLVRRAHEADRLIDFTMGGRPKAVVILDSGQVVLSAITPWTLAVRIREVGSLDFSSVMCRQECSAAGGG